MGTHLINVLIYKISRPQVTGQEAAGSFPNQSRTIANAIVNNSQEPSKTCSKCFLLLQSSFKTKVLERYNSLRVLHILWQTFHSRLDIESYFDLSTETCPCPLLVSGCLIMPQRDNFKGDSLTLIIINPQ